MSLLRRAALLLALALATLPAAASFHLMSMNELYSSPDGKIQYVEITALTGGQQFVFGHSIACSQGGVTHTFQIQRNLPGDTTNKRWLIATQSFADLGVVTPEIIVPDNFFFMGNGTLNWGESSDIWNYSGLPADGVLSLNRDGSTASNSPQNFSGQVGHVTLNTAPPLNFQALWWRAPAGSESGWGVNVTHQGDILFATWFTYDTDGSGMWLVMSSANKVSDNTYSGTLYRTTGPAFNSVPFNSASVNVNSVGSGTFTFTDANSGTFTYTVNGVTQSKTITRQVFANPVPTCAANGTAGATPNYQDLWWNSPAGSESGWGVNITHQGDTLFATWFTYAADGKGLWLVMSNGVKQSDGSYVGDLFSTTGPAFNSTPFDPSKVAATKVGTATFRFSDSNTGTFAYTVNGVSQTKNITRQVYSSPTTVCK